jgi:hypothetical protein
MKTLKYQFIFFQGVQLVPHRREFLFLRGEPVDTIIYRRPGVWTVWTAWTPVTEAFVAVSDPYLSPESHDALPYTHSTSVIEYPSGRNIIREIEENTHPDARL